MKKIFLIAAVAVSALFLLSCQNKVGYKLTNLTTFEAVQNDNDTFTFSAKADWSSDNSAAGSFGVMYCQSAGVSKDNYLFVTGEQILSNGTNNHSKTVNNYIEIFGTKSYYFKKGETCYYRAYARVSTGSGDSDYFYGEEKSFVVK